MPKKKGKKGSKKGKGKKNKVQAASEREEMMVKTKNLMKIYPTFCTSKNISPGAIVINSLKQCVEDEKPLVKIIMDSQKSTLGRTKRKAGKSTSSSSVPAVESLEMPLSSTGPPVQLSPLLESLSAINYTYMRCLHVWQISMIDEEMVALALFMAGTVGHEVRVLDLTNCSNITSWGMQRLSRAFSLSQLVHITLDYNKLTDESIHSLCNNLTNNFTLNSLNLNYCQLSSSCGEPLGYLAATTQLRFLGLQGNRLQTKGATDLLQNLVSLSERNEMMPLLARLCLQDNEIDGCGEGIFAPVSCMQMLRRWLSSSKVIEDIKLDGNLIGDSAAREVLLGQQQRKEAGYPSIQLTITNKVSSETFAAIVALTSSGGGKRKKPKKKGKKKKK